MDMIGFINSKIPNIRLRLLYQLAKGENMKNDGYARCCLVIVLSFFILISSSNVLGFYQISTENDEPTEPNVEITSPSQGSMLGQDDLEDDLKVTWSSGDPEGEIVSTVIELAGHETKHIDTGNTVTFENVPSGEHEVIATVTNDEDLSASHSVEFIIDRIDPDLEIESPGDGESISNTTVVVRWGGDGGLSGIREYRVRVNREDPWESVGTDTSYELTELDEDDYLVEVEATDNAWNTRVRRVNFIVDGTPPTINILSPPEEDSQISQSNFVTIIWSGRDEGSGIDHYEVRINGGEWEDVGTRTEYTFSGLFDGEHTVDIKAVDNAGNEQIESTTFEVDPGSPSEVFTMRLILLTMVGILIIGILAIVMFWKYIQDQRRFNKREIDDKDVNSKKKSKKKIPIKKKKKSKNKGS